MENLPILKNWKIRKDEDQILWLGLDKHDSSTNTLNAEVLEELKELLDALVKQTLPKGLVIYSLKENGFIAGADIQQFKNFDSEDQAFQLIRKGQLILQQLEDFPVPTLALIHGFCLGGGLELALACHYRIVIQDSKTKIGLPEVMLGIHPGWGGTIRLPKLIGSLKGMDLVLSGRTVNGKTAYKMGFVDALVPKRHCLKAVKYYILNKPEQKQAKGLDALTNWDPLRPLMAKFLRKKLAEKVNRIHYPAPYAALDTWLENGIRSDAAYVAEAKSISQLMVSDTAQNLVRVFFLQEKLKSLSRKSKYKLQHLHVVGAGVMGGDIAAVAALRGLTVTLQDQNNQSIAKALGRASVLFKKVLKEPFEIQKAMDRLIPDIKGDGIMQADIILEAIIEKKEAKQALFKQIEQQAKKDALLATNTSTIPIEEIAESLQEPERLIGIHFFNPATKMPLIEIVKSEYTSDESLEKAMAFVKVLDKLPVPVKSAPGFLVNRLLSPYLLESMQLLQEGVPKEAIDKAAIDFGMPMGPIELADTVGLDVCIYAAQSLHEEVPVEIKALVSAGHLGKKTGQGLYQYKNDKPIKETLDPNYKPPEDIIDRLMLRMINEAIACLREGIVAEPDYLDAAMIFGIGFPPFLGGPMHYCEEQGEGLMLQRLNLLVQRYGERFSADAGWGMLDAA